MESSSGTEYEWAGDFIAYAERFRFYLQAKKIVNAELRRAEFCAKVGQRTFNLLRDLVAPASIHDKSFDELIGILSDHFAPKANKFKCRFKFNSRDRRPGEDFATYLANLKNLSSVCDFGANLEDRLVERIICGVQNEELLGKLLELEGLTYTMCVQRCVNFDNLKAEDFRKVQVHAVKSKGQAINSTCSRCSGNHVTERCKFKNYTCHRCGKLGHLKYACRGERVGAPYPAARISRNATARRVEDSGPNETLEADPIDTSDYEIQVNHTDICNQVRVPEFSLDLRLEGKLINFQIDTGSDVTILCKHDYQLIKSSMEPVSGPLITLRSYSGDIIDNKGRFKVNVEYKDIQKPLQLVVCEGTSRSLLGRDWLGVLRLDFNELLRPLECDKVESWDSAKIFHEFSEIFLSDDSKGIRPAIKNMKVKLNVDLSKLSKLPYCKARKVPLALIKGTNIALDKLIDQKVISPIENSNFSTPIVPIVKTNGSVRICGSYDVTINKALSIDGYNLPIVEYELSNLSECSVFSKLDLKDAYTQLELDDDSKLFTTINTHRGRFVYNRLCFGISSAPGIFAECIQRIVDTEFPDRHGIALWYDDIAVGGIDRAEHDKVLIKLLNLFKKFNVCLNQAKCVFALPRIEFLGMIVSGNGISVCPKKMSLVQRATEPKNVPELRSFLGFVNFLLKFIPNLAEITQPMSKLLRSENPWQWQTDQQESFRRIKQAVEDSQILIPYSQDLPVHLMCDASPVAVGSCLFHVLEDGQRKPIAFSSRVLSSIESRYSQLEREALGVFSAVKKFHSYLYGRHCILWTDHKPLCSILKLGQEYDNPVSPRILRWSVALKAYDYEIRHVAGKDNFTDWLSRYVKPDSKTVRAVNSLPEDVPGEIQMNVRILEEELSLGPEMWHKGQREDPVLCKIINYISDGWPEQSLLQDSEKLFYRERYQLSVVKDCLWFADRMVVPKDLVEATP